MKIIPRCPGPPGVIASAWRGRQSRRLSVTTARRSVRARFITSGSEGATHPGWPAMARTSCPRSRSSRAMAGTASHRAAASRPDGVLPGGPGRVGFGGLLLIGLDPLVDLVPVGAVVADGGLDEAERDLQIARRLGGVAPVVAYRRDDLPDVLARPCEPGPPSGGPVGEPDERVVIHPQASSTYRWARVRGASCARCACLPRRAIVASFRRTLSGWLM